MTAALSIFAFLSVGPPRASPIRLPTWPDVVFSEETRETSLSVPNAVEADPDLSLVLRAQGGDLHAFDELVRRHQALIAGMLFRFCPWQADLEDLVQETFVRAYRAIAQWQPRKPFLHWLKRIAANVGLEYCRKNTRSPLALQVPSTEDCDPLSTIPAPAERDPKAGATAEAHWLLSHLKPDDRTLLTLLYLDEMPLAEIAGHFRWSVTNTKVRAFRARAQLRKILQRHGYHDS